MKIAYFPSAGVLNPATGYGKMEIALAQALRDAGVELDMDPKGAGGFDEIALFFGDPRWGMLRGGLRRLWLYTMSESTAPSPRWVDEINRFYERVIVCAPGLVDYYRAAGVEKPVTYIPLGVDFAEIAWKAHPVNEGEPFTFLTYSLGDMRKGAELAIMSFLRVWGGNPSYQMRVKARSTATWLDGLNEPQIIVVNGQTPEDDWHTLLHSAHAFVFPSRGEGFGLPPREATLAGLPTLATEWLGMWDVRRWGYALPVRDLRPCHFSAYEANADGALWAEPDRMALDGWMYSVPRHYEQAVVQARQGRAYLMEHFCWARAGCDLAELLDAEA